MSTQDTKGSEVRWIESEYLKQQSEGNDDEDCGSECFDMFADPDPMQTFVFNWTIDDEIDDDTKGMNRTIEIELLGYKAELGQTLHSTGLTLWRASELLCNFMVRERNTYISNKSILEVRTKLEKI